MVLYSSVHHAWSELLSPMPSFITHTCRQHSSLTQPSTQQPSNHQTSSSRGPPQPSALPSYRCHPSHRQHTLAHLGAISCSYLYLWEPSAVGNTSLNHPSRHMQKSVPGTFNGHRPVWISLLMLYTIYTLVVLELQWLHGRKSQKPTY